MSLSLLLLGIIYRGISSYQASDVETSLVTEEKEKERVEGRTREHQMQQRIIPDEWANV
jgi:hypothetical protein